jgi:hypothetical protein
VWTKSAIGIVGIKALREQCICRELKDYFLNVDFEELSKKTSWGSFSSGEMRPEYQANII